MRTSTISVVLAIAALTSCSDAGGTGPVARPAAVGPLEPVAFSAAPGCVTVRMSESAVFDGVNFNTVGSATIDGVPRTFTSIVYTLDANWDRYSEGKNFKADQREVFTFDGGDELYVEGPVMSVPMSAPGIYEATGGSSKFVGGTGEFDGARGNAFVKGVTVFTAQGGTSIAWYNAELCR